MNLSPSSLTIPLDSMDATKNLAEALAHALVTTKAQNLFFQGSLGAGKTTLARYLVLALPKGKEADFASPSFTICNIYSTSPEVHHYDLYRLETGTREESLEESFDTQGIITLVEWSERLLPKDLPKEGVVCHLGFSSKQNKRRACILPIGLQGNAALALIAAFLSLDTHGTKP